MSLNGRVGAHFHADEGVVVGYPPTLEISSSLILGRGARLRSGTVLYDGTEIGDRLETGHNVVIRENSSIGNDVSIWSHSVIDYGCVIGDRVRVHSNCYIAQFSELRDDVFIGPGVTFANDLYPGDSGSAERMCGPCIGQGVRIGANVTILPYVSVGRDALIGAGSVVTRDVLPGMVAYGCPAVTARRVDELVDIRDRVLRVEGPRRRFTLRANTRGDKYQGRRR